MESKIQAIEIKVNKKSAKNTTKYASARMSLASKKFAISLRDEANKKAAGRTVMMDEIFDLALSLVTKEHLKSLQERSLSHEDRKELLRQKYIERHGTISKDDWTGFTMTPQFHEFLRTLPDVGNAA